ncbi:Glycine N-methyltransferase, partial [Aptenodytes forsteri]
ALHSALVRRAGGGVRRRDRGLVQAPPDGGSLPVPLRRPRAKREGHKGGCWVVIEEANWLTLEKDLEKPGDGFDAVICLGNSFAHLPDFKGDQSDHKLALRNIASMVRPGGVLVIDHRNYDHILATGCAPPGKNIYYKSDLTKDITTSVLLVNNKAHMVTLDYTVQVPPTEAGAAPELSKFRLSYYPHRLEAFTALLKGAFQGKCQHSVLGDFQPYTPGQAHVPCYFIHVVKKTA